MPDPPTLSTEAVHTMNKSDDLELTCRYQLVAHRQVTHRQSHSVSLHIVPPHPFPGQRSAVPEVVDSADERSLLDLRLQRLGPLLHHAAHLKRHRQRDGPVPVFLPGPEGGGRQDVGGHLRVCQRCGSSLSVKFLSYFLLMNVNSATGRR